MQVFTNITAIFNKLLDFIYKKKCYFCGSSKESVKMCSKCYESLTHKQPAMNRAIEGVRVYSAGVYDKNLQKLIRGIKYHRQKELGFYMAKFMWEYFMKLAEKEGLTQEFEVVPVPLHKKRQRKRGYNHMEIVGTEFCQLSGFEPNYKLIERIKNTKPQYKLSYSEKEKNLENAFRVNKENYNNKPLLIIDDICTSGSTFSSMIKELKSNGINEIVCFSASSPDY